MAQSHLHQSVLPANPQADNRSYISGLLDELGRHIDGLAVVPGQTIPVDARKIMDLRGAYLAANIAIRNTLKWAL